MLRLVLRYLLPPALAALAVVAFEVLRTTGVGATQLGGFGGLVSFTAAVAGLLGLPLWLLGGALIAATDGVRAGWRWGRGAVAAPSPERRAAWALFGVIGAAILVLGVKLATQRFVRAFRQPVYQGLGAGLTAAGIVAGLAMLAGPIVGALGRGLGALRRRLPPWADFATGRGAALWVGGLTLLGVVLAPVVLSELKTVDLRPARLALGWIALLIAAPWAVARWLRPRVALAVAAVVAALFAGGMGWSAVALGRSPSRLLALNRDTLLAGPVARRFRKLADRDGDGLPALFAGGDCDDTNPEVRPGRYDVPRDGRDQNCTGEDLDLAQDPLLPPPRPPADASRPRWNVVLLTIDAVRDDAARALMPRLQALAAESVDYRNAYAHGAATYWSLPALLASTMPSRLEMGRDQTPVNAHTLLTEVLRDHGWHTALFANVTIFFVRGLRQGTHVANYDTSHFTVHGAKPGSEHLTDGMLKHIRAWKNKQLKGWRDRFFLWGHYYDPHDPYFDVPGFPSDEDSDRGRYDAILRYTDVHLGRMIDGLKSEGLWDSTVLIVSADHGDEFLDHGHRFHGATLYEEMVHVPLVIHVPGVPPRVFEPPIGHLEVAPTVAELLGLPIPPAWLGRSRAHEILTGEPAPDEPVYLEVFQDSNYAGHQVGLRLGRHKLIYNIEDNVFELYDLVADPPERDNLFGDDPESDSLRHLLMRYVDHHLYALGQGKTGAVVPPGSPKPKAAPVARKRKPSKRKKK